MSKTFKDTIIMAVAIKILIFSLGFVVTCLNERVSPSPSILMRQFYRWDSPHYVDIAKNGYVNFGEQSLFIVFFPLYPFLIRLATFDYHYMELSALLVSNISSIVAMVYLFKIAKLEFGEETAKRSVMYLSIYPTAYFLSAPFTESVFLAFAIACFYCAIRGKWMWSGFLGLLASLTRINGLILLPALIIEYLSQKKWKLRDVDFDITWIGLTLVGFLVYLFINYEVTGNFFTFMEIQRTHWYQTLDPLLGLDRAWQWATTASFPQNITVGSAQLVFAILGLLCTVGSFLRLRLSYSFYMLFTWMMCVSTSFWISIPRYTLAMFPLFILLGVIGNSKKFNYIALPSCLMSLTFFTILFSSGQWAF
jgi:hypothetical protein